MYKRRTFGRLGGNGIGSVTYDQTGFNNRGIFNTYVMSRIPYWDPGTASVVPISMVAGAAQLPVPINVVSSQYFVVYRNNTEVDANLSLYFCVPKLDTNATPIGAMNDSFGQQDAMQLAADTLAASPIITSGFPLQFPTDSAAFRRFWRIVRVKKKLLRPGMQLSMGVTCGNVAWDPNFYSHHNLEYQRSLCSGVFLARLEGTLSHDAASVVRLTDVQLDCMKVSKHVLKYEAGNDLDELRLVDGDSAAFNTATGVQEQRPVSAQQGYAYP